MLQVTSIEELKALSQAQQGEVIEIPGFRDNDTLKVKVRPISLMELTQCDILPNYLLIAVNDITNKSKSGEEITPKEAAAAKITMEKFTDIVYSQALVEPSVKTLNELGLKLNLVQKRMIAEYSLGDLSSLSRFRQVRKNLESNTSS